MKPVEEYMEKLKNKGLVGSVTIYADAASVLHVLGQFRPKGPVAVGARQTPTMADLASPTWMNAFASPKSSADGTGVVVIAVATDIEGDQPV